MRASGFAGFLPALFLDSLASRLAVDDEAPVVVSEDLEVLPALEPRGRPCCLLFDAAAPPPAAAVRLLLLLLPLLSVVPVAAAASAVVVVVVVVAATSVAAVLDGAVVSKADSFCFKNMEGGVVDPALLSLVLVLERDLLTCCPSRTYFC